MDREATGKMNIKRSAALIMTAVLCLRLIRCKDGQGFDSDTRWGNNKGSGIDFWNDVKKALSPAATEFIIDISIFEGPDKL